LKLLEKFKFIDNSISRLVVITIVIEMAIMITLREYRISLDPILHLSDLFEKFKFIDNSISRHMVIAIVICMIN